MTDSRTEPLWRRATICVPKQSMPVSMQANSIHKDLLQTGSWSDPVANARMAHTLWSKSGWRPWVAYTNGSYMRFIVRADRAVNNPNPLPNNIDPNAPKPTAPDAGGDVLSFIDLISDGRTWQRIGMAVIGAVILIYAAAKMTGDNKLGGVAKGAINVGASALAKKPIKVA